MEITHLVNSYKFWDFVALWAREQLVHESLVARALIAGVIKDGLRIHSIDPRWLDQVEPLRGDPYVGYCPDPSKKPVILKLEVLDRFLDVYRKGSEPSALIIRDEFVTKKDFQAWLVGCNQPLPRFWFEVPQSSSL